MPPAPLRVAAVTLVHGNSGVLGGSPISVSFTSPVAPGSPHPLLAPRTAGAWHLNGRTMTFTPSTPYSPLTDVSLLVPSGGAGVASAAGAHLSHPYRTHFAIANGSTLRLNQLLSLLRYSPLEWTATGAAPSRTDTAGQLEALYRPPAGSFAWRAKGWPSQLMALWHPVTWGVMTKGLVMSFEADHGLTPNGTVDATLWKALIAALAANDANTGGYNYALGNKAQPESLTVWHDGTVAAHVPANTGIAAAPTPDGNFPVYVRLRAQVMRGTNPDGSSYADPVQYVAYFNGSDAVHYLPRANYGIPQSLGCIELSLTDAATVWPYLAYGTIVSVIN